MKNIIVLIIVIAAAVMAFNYFQSKSDLPADEQQVAELEESFDVMAKEFNQAIRSTGATGIDTTENIDSVLDGVKRIEKQLKSLEGSLESQSAKDRAKRLKRKISDFKRKFGT